MKESRYVGVGRAGDGVESGSEVVSEAEVEPKSKGKGKGKGGKKSDVDSEISSATTSPTAAATATATATATTPAAVVLATRPAPAASEGITEPARLASNYVSALVRASDDALGGGGVSAADYDPKLILRRFAADLVSAIESGPEWPAAELMLASLLAALAARLPEVGGSIAAPLSSVVATAALGALGPALGRVLRLRAYATHSALVLPEPGGLPLASLSPSTKSKSSGSVGGNGSGASAYEFSCVCGRGFVKNVFAIACDECASYSHGACVYISEERVPEWWSCDACRMRAAITQARATLGAGAGAGAGAGITPTTTPLREKATIRFLVFNHVTDRAHESIFARMARRFLIAKWASAAMTARDVPLR